MYAQAKLLCSFKSVRLKKDLLYSSIENYTILKQNNSFHSKACCFVKDCLQVSNKTTPVSSKIIVFTQTHLFCKGLSAFFNGNLHHSQAQLLFSFKNICFGKADLYCSIEFAPLSSKTIVFTEKHMFCKGLSSFSMKNCTTLR